MLFEFPKNFMAENNALAFDLSPWLICMSFVKRMDVYD